MDVADRHIQMIQDHLVADRDAWIADEQRRADEAAAAGDERSYRHHLEEIAEIKAKWFSWERSEE
jgi:hypothetical protein